MREKASDESSDVMILVHLISAELKDQSAHLPFEEIGFQRVTGLALCG